MSGLTRLDDALQAAIDRARKACEERDARERAKSKRRYEHQTTLAKVGHDVSEMSRDEKRQCFADAKAGKMGDRWKVIAKQANGASIFMDIWERWATAPTDEELQTRYPWWVVAG